MPDTLNTPESTATPKMATAEIKQVPGNRRDLDFESSPPSNWHLRERNQYEPKSNRKQPIGAQGEP